MSPNEAQILNDFLSQLVRVGPVSKDPEADVAIARAVAQQPNATYLLVQRALMLDQALQQAGERINALQAELKAARAQAGGQIPGNPGFLDSANAWGRHAAVRPAVANPAPTPMYAPPPAAAAPTGGFGTAGSVLGQVATTAAGVAAGAFLFQGIESLMGGGHHGWGGNTASLQPIDNTTINNYFAETPRADAGADTYADAGSLEDFPLDDGGVTDI